MLTQTTARIQSAPFVVSSAQVDDLRCTLDAMSDPGAIPFAEDALRGLETWPDDRIRCAARMARIIHHPYISSYVRDDGTEDSDRNMSMSTALGNDVSFQRGPTNLRATRPYIAAGKPGSFGLDESAEDEALCMSMLASWTPQRVGRGKSRAFTDKMLIDGDEYQKRLKDMRKAHRNERRKRIRRWARVVALLRIYSARTHTELADALALIDDRRDEDLHATGCGEPRYTGPAWSAQREAMARVERITRWNMTTADDRCRQAHNRARRELRKELAKLAQQYPAQREKLLKLPRHQLDAIITARAVPA